VLTVLEAAHPYWLLYEGTPGGQRKDGKTKGPLDEADGFCLRPGKGRTGVHQKWDGDVRGDGKVEWVAFGNTRVGRTLLFIHHTDDGAVDSYWPMQHNMTVFGFGRKGLSKHMKKTPDRFTVALIQTADEDEIRSRVAALARFAE